MAPKGYSFTPKTKRNRVKKKTYTPPTPEKFVAPEPTRKGTQGVTRSGTSPSAPGRAPVTRVPRKERARQEQRADAFRRRVAKANKRIKRQERAQRRAERRWVRDQIRYRFRGREGGGITGVERAEIEAFKRSPSYERSRKIAQREGKEYADKRMIRDPARPRPRGLATPGSTARKMAKDFGRVSRKLREVKPVKIPGLKGGGTIATTRGPITAAAAPKGSSIAVNALADVAELTGTAPTSAAMTAEMLKTGKGRRKLLDSLKNKTTIGNLLQGRFKKAARLAEKRPASTFLEVAGGYGALGRTAGAVGRRGVPSKRVRRAVEHRAGRLPADKRRSPRRLYESRESGPVVERDWSKNAITMAAQKAAQKRRRKRETPAERRRREDYIARGNVAVMKKRRARDLAATISAQERVMDAERHSAASRARKAVKQARGRRKPGKRRLGRDVAATGVLNVGRATIRSRKTFDDDIRARIAELDASFKRAKDEGHKPSDRNRAEAEHLATILSKSKAEKDRIYDAGVRYGREEHAVQQSARAEGGLPPQSESARLRPAAITHKKAEPGQARRTAEYERQLEAEQEAATLTKRAKAARESWQSARVRAADARGTAKAQVARARQQGGDFAERQQRILSGNMPESVAPRWLPDEGAVRQSAREMGIKNRVVIRRGIGGMDAAWRFRDGVHVIDVPNWLSPEKANSLLWHELQHARQFEQGRWKPSPGKEAAYRTSVQEAEAGLRGRLGRTREGRRTLARTIRRQDLTEGQGAHLMRAELDLEDARRYNQRTQAARRTAERVAKERRVPKSRQRETPWMQERGSGRAITPDEIKAELQALGRDPETVTHITTEKHGRGPSPAAKSKGKTYERGEAAVGMEAIVRQSLAGAALDTGTALHNSVVRRYGLDVRVGGSAVDPQTGRRYAPAHAAALDAAKRHNDANPGANVVPFNIAKYREAGEWLRVLQEKGATLDEIVDQARRLTDAVDGNIEHGQGKWVLMPEDVRDQLLAYEQASPFGNLDRFTRHWKDVVLTSASPSSWIFANAADLFMRSLAEGLTPADLVRGLMVNRRLRKGSVAEREMLARWTSGGLYHSSEASPNFRGGFPVWQQYKGSIYKLEHAIEVAPQLARLGKAVRDDVAWSRSAKGLLRMQTSQIEAFINGQKLRPGAIEKTAGQIEDVIGRWGKLSPQMRRFRSMAPFAQWLMAATRYVYWTLPAKHPIKTGIYAALSQALEQDRRELGMSLLAPEGGPETLDRAQDYQQGLVGSWLPWQNLAPSTVKTAGGPRAHGFYTGRLTSFGTAAPTGVESLPGFVFPQFRGVFGAFQAEAWTGEDMVYPDWYPVEDMRGQEIQWQDKLHIAAGAFIEGTMPGAIAARRIVFEKGRPSYPTSTILTPETRRKWDEKKGKYVEEKATALGGLAEWGDPLTKRTAYTIRDLKRFEESREAGRVFGRQKEEREKERRRGGAGWYSESAPKVKPKKKKNAGGTGGSWY